MAISADAPTGHILAHIFKQRGDGFNRVIVAGGEDIELGRCRDIGTAHHRRGHVLHAMFGVQGGHALGKGYGHRRHVHVNSAALHPGKRAGFDDHLLADGIVGEYREHHIGVRHRGFR